MILCVIERRVLESEVKVLPSFEQALGASAGQPRRDILQNRERLHQPLPGYEYLTNGIQSIERGLQVDVVSGRDGDPIDDLQDRRAEGAMEGAVSDGIPLCTFQ